MTLMKKMAGELLTIFRDDQSMPTGSTRWFASEGPRDAELARNGKLWRGRFVANDLFAPACT